MRGRRNFRRHETAGDFVARRIQRARGAPLVGGRSSRARARRGRSSPAQARERASHASASETVSSAWVADLGNGDRPGGRSVIERAPGAVRSGRSSNSEPPLTARSRDEPGSSPTRPGPNGKDRQAQAILRAERARSVRSQFVLEKHPLIGGSHRLSIMAVRWQLPLRPDPVVSVSEEVLALLPRDASSVASRRRSRSAPRRASGFSTSRSGRRHLPPVCSART
jgi:hypothetical protein